MEEIKDRRGRKKELPRDNNGRIILGCKKTIQPKHLDEGLDYFKSSVSTLYDEISKEVLDVDKSIISKIIKCYQRKVAERIMAGFSVDLGAIGIAWVYHRPGGKERRVWGKDTTLPPKRILMFSYRTNIKAKQDKANADMKYEFRGITPEERAARRQRFINMRKEINAKNAANLKQE